MFLYECSVGLSSIAYEWPHRYIHPPNTSFAAPQFNEERREKKKQTQSLKLFEFFLNQMSMVLTSGDGLILETAPPTTVHSQSIPHPFHAQHISFPSDN